MITAKTLKQQFDNEYYRATDDYRHMEKRISFYQGNPMVDIKEMKLSKWYQKQPHYRPTGQATWHVRIIHYDDPDKPATNVEHVQCDKLKDVAMILNAYDVKPNQE